MAEYHISTDWVDVLAFDAHIDPFTIRMDSPIVEEGATGPSPKRLVLAALRNNFV